MSESLEEWIVRATPADERFLQRWNGLVQHERDVPPAWWRRAARSEHIASLEATRADVDRLAPAAASLLVHRELCRRRGEVTRRNPYHPEVLEIIDILAREIATTVANRSAGDFGRGRTWGEILEIAPHLEPSQVRATIAAGVAAFSRAVADDRMLTARGLDEHGAATVVVQHQASGLRARFTALADLPGFGVIFSKPYRIPSIDPEAPDSTGDDWERYAGGGIGRRIYLEGAALMPELRWKRSGATSPAADRVRERLHRRDPLRWDSALCDWCRGRRIDWGTAVPETFDTHPTSGADNGGSVLQRL